MYIHTCTQSTCGPKVLQQRSRQNSSEAASFARVFMSEFERSSCAKSPSVRYSTVVESGPVGSEEKTNVCAIGMDRSRDHLTATVAAATTSSSVVV